MAIITDIIASIDSKITAITPTVRPGYKFSSLAGATEPARRIGGDSAADRAFRVISQHNAVRVHPFGGTAGMWRVTLVLYITYLGMGDDSAMHARIDADFDQIVDALMLPNLSWPNTSEGVFADIEDVGVPFLEALDEGANTNLYQIPLICLYERK